MFLNLFDHHTTYPEKCSHSLGYLTDHDHIKPVQPPDTEPGTLKDHQHQSDIDGDHEIQKGQTEVSKDVLLEQPQPDPQPLNGTPGQGGH